jgi:hypothetical protein
MRTILYSITVMAFLLASCKKSPENKDILTIRDAWKFKTGDNLEWAEPGFNDSQWDTLTARLFWERQGYPGYDGYAWYRKSVFIPSYLKKNSFFGDTLQFVLGLIDDTDQTFLNGQPLGSNGQSISEPQSEFQQSFEGDQLAYSYYRVYKIPADDPRILWDQNNVLAIRVHDHGGNGGLFNPEPSVSMIDLKEFIDIESMRASG